MNRLGHQAAAQVTWLGLCTHHQLVGTPFGWQHVLAGAIVASSTCADDWSPDADQGGWIAKVIPGGHRGPTHMPELVTAVLAGMWWAFSPIGLAWFVLAVASGWGSHLAIDAPFGRIPLALAGGRRVGLRLDTGGPTERALTWLMAVVSVPLAWVALGLPGTADLVATLTRS